MPLKLRAHNTCREAILEGDYKNKLICGESQKYGPGQMITMVIELEIFKIYLYNFLKTYSV